MDINKKALTLSYKEKADVTIFICNKKIILCSWLVTSIILLNYYLEYSSEEMSNLVKNSHT